MPIEIIRRSKVSITTQSINKRYQAIIRSLSKMNLKKKTRIKKDLILVLVDKPEIQRLNKLYRKKDKPTDVLSFSGIEIDQLGELVICLPVAKAQAKENDHALLDEVTYLILHGILHLLGYDHELPNVRAKDAEQMFKIQDKVFLQFQK